MSVSAYTRTLLGCLVIVFGSAASAADRKPFGDALSTDQFGRARTIDVEHYRLDLEFDPDAGEVRGTTSIVLSPLNDGLSIVELDAGATS